MNVVWGALLLSTAAVFYIVWMRMTSSRKKLMENGTCVQAKVVSIAEGRTGAAYSLEFRLKGEKKRAAYPKRSNGKQMKIGDTCVLYIDTKSPKGKVYVDGDPSVETTEKIFLLGAEVCVAIFLIVFIQSLPSAS